MKAPSPTQFTLLEILRAGPVAGKELYARWESKTGRTISKGTLYGALAILHRAGLVDSQESASGDRRNRDFTLTTMAMSTFSEMLEQEMKR